MKSVLLALFGLSALLSLASSHCGAPHRGCGCSACSGDWRPWGPAPCHNYNPCVPVVNQVPLCGRIVIQEAAPGITEYVEGEPVVVHQEAPPRYTFGDTTPIRLTHHAKPYTIEHFETPVIIDHFQQPNFINHASKPVVIDHYQAPTYVREEGLPAVYEACDCGCGAPAPHCAGRVVAPCPCGCS